MGLVAASFPSLQQNTQGNAFLLPKRLLCVPISFIAVRPVVKEPKRRGYSKCSQETERRRRGGGPIIPFKASNDPVSFHWALLHKSSIVPSDIMGQKDQPFQIWVFGGIAKI